MGTSNFEYFCYREMVNHVLLQELVKMTMAREESYPADFTIHCLWGCFLWFHVDELPPTLANHFENEHHQLHKELRQRLGSPLLKTRHSAHSSDQVI